MNNKSDFNSLLNQFKKSVPVLDEKKSYSIFLGSIIFIIVVLLIIIVRRQFNQMKILSEEIKSTFFLEMLEFKSPYDAWDSDTKICIRGKNKKTHKIPGRKLGPRIKNTYTLMFWVKINTNKFDDYKKHDGESINSLTSSKLVAFGDGDGDGDDGVMYPGFFIKPLNNTLTVKMTGDDGVHKESEVYNFPYDKWTCISTYVTKDYIEIYIDGKLLKTSEFASLNISPDKLDMYIGTYPGLLAFLSVNIDPHFGSDGIYKEYLYYKNIIDIYEQSRYKTEYNHDRSQNPDKYKSFKQDFIKKKADDSNICKS